MPRKKKLDITNKNDLRNYTEIDDDSFWTIYKNLGNKQEYLKMIDTHKSTGYYIWTEFFKNKI